MNPYLAETAGIIRGIRKVMEENEAEALKKKVKEMEKQIQDLVEILYNLSPAVILDEITIAKIYAHEAQKFIKTISKR